VAHRRQAQANRQHKDEIDRVKDERGAARPGQAERAERRAKLVTPDIPDGRGFSFWNGSEQRITGFRVVKLVDEPTGSEGRVSPRGLSGSDAAGVIDSSKNAHFSVRWATSGTPQGPFTIIYRFTDSGSQRWERRWDRGKGAEPRRVPVDDSDLS